MKNDAIKDLVQDTFSRLACPANGHGMYAEIEKAILEAYNIGKAQQESHHLIHPQDELQFNYFRA